MSLSGSKSAVWSRPLGAIEKLFWLMDQNRPLHFVMAAEIDGSTSKEAWRSALNSAFKDTRVIRSQIVRDKDRQPMFVEGNGSDVDVKFVGGDPRLFLPYVERDLSLAFNSEVGPLMRAVVLFERNHSTLIISVHHAIADGLALTSAVCNVIRRLRGEAVQVYQAEEPVESQVARSQGGRPLPVIPPPDARPDGFRGYRNSSERSPHIARAIWPEFFVRTLHAQASSEAVKMHSTLCAAFAGAYRSLTGERSRDLRIFTPLDVRARLLGRSEHFGVAVSGTVTSSDSPSGAFWNEARAIERQLSPYKQPEGIIALVGTIQALMKNIVEVGQATDFMAANLGCDILMSNLGAIDLPGKPRGFALRHLWGPAVTWGFRNEQSLGFLSLHGELHFIHTSFTPVHGLLEKARAVLENAVRA